MRPLKEATVHADVRVGECGRDHRRPPFYARPLHVALHLCAELDHPAAAWIIPCAMSGRQVAARVAGPRVAGRPKHGVADAAQSITAQRRSVTLGWLKQGAGTYRTRWCICQMQAKGRLAMPPCNLLAVHMNRSTCRSG